MSNDEIVVRYRQAKHKGEQLNILADLNACSVDEIVNVLVEHGGYKLERMSRSRGKAKLLRETAPTEPVPPAVKKPYKKPEIIPEPAPVKEPEPEKIPPVVKRALDSGFKYLADEIDARLNRIEELKAEIEEFEKDIAALRAWEEEHT